MSKMYKESCDNKSDIKLCVKFYSDGQIGQYLVKTGLRAKPLEFFNNDVKVDIVGYETLDEKKSLKIREGLVISGKFCRYELSSVEEYGEIVIDLNNYLIINGVKFYFKY